MGIFKKVKYIWNNIIDKATDGTKEHFACLYPGNSGILPPYIADIFSDKIKLNH